jgi:hypothetical protein
MALFFGITNLPGDEPLPLGGSPLAPLDSGRLKDLNLWHVLMFFASGFMPPA